jgi:hypothetical protein
MIQDATLSVSEGGLRVQEVRDLGFGVEGLGFRVRG